MVCCTVASTLTPWSTDPDRDQYEEDLRRRQREHLDNVHRRGRPFQPCMHDECSQCCGTGIKHDGSACVHMISCSCPKCTPWC